MNFDENTKFSIKETTISLADFSKEAIKGKFGHYLNRHSANSYKANIRSIIRKYNIDEVEFLCYPPQDVAALLDLLKEDQSNNRPFRENTFKALIAALTCYHAYIHFKYTGVVAESIRTRKCGAKSRECKAGFWSCILKWFGFRRVFAS